MRWWWIFACLVLLCLVLGGVLVRQEPANGHGLPHPRFATIDRGGPAARHDDLMWAGWLYGVLQLALFVSLLLIGLRRGSTGAGMIRIIGAAVIAAFTIMMLVYQKHMHTSAAAMILGYPVSTALMLFLFWPLPVLFVVLYIIKFDRWIADPDKIAKALSGKATPRD